MEHEKTYVKWSGYLSHNGNPNIMGVKVCKWVDDHPLWCFFPWHMWNHQPLEKPKSDKPHPFIASEEHNQTTADFGSHRSATWWSTSKINSSSVKHGCLTPHFHHKRFSREIGHSQNQADHHLFQSNLPSSLNLRVRLKMLVTQKSQAELIIICSPLKLPYCSVFVPWSKHG